MNNLAAYIFKQSTLLVLIIGALGSLIGVIACSCMCLVEMNNGNTLAAAGYFAGIVAILGLLYKLDNYEKDFKV